MILSKRVCDHCKKELDMADDYPDMDIEIGVTWIKTDLCFDCKKKLVGICIDFVNEVHKNG